MLRARLTTDEWDALPEPLREHYRKGSEDGEDVYLLETDGTSRVERALASERTIKRRLERHLKALLPELSDRKPDEWEEAVEEAAERHRELSTAFDDEEELSEFRQWKASGKGEKGDAELREQLAEAEREKRELERTLRRAESDREAAQTKLQEASARSSRLAIERDLSSAMDDARITDPWKRKALRGIVQGLHKVETREFGEDELETVVVADDGEIPVVEWVRDYVATDEGKALVSAPDNSGGGDGEDGGKSPRRGGSRRDADEVFDALPPEAQLGQALSEKTA